VHLMYLFLYHLLANTRLSKGCSTMLEIVTEFVIDIGIRCSTMLSLCRFFSIVEQGTLE